MTDASKPWIRSIGAFTAAGSDAPTTMGSILSGAQMFDELDLASPEGTFITGAVTPLARTVKGIDRLGMLGLIALLECAGKDPVNDVPVLVCAPTEAKRGPGSERLLDIIVGDARFHIDRRASKVFSCGRDAVGHALALARELLVVHRECFVVAVDSLVDHPRLRLLASRGRVLGAGVPDGIIPGEAGVALRLSVRGSEDIPRLVAAAGRGDAEDDRVSGLGDAEVDDPVLGLGLAEAVDLCFHQLAHGAGAYGGHDSRTERTDAIFADAVGPQARAEELAFARRRKALEVAAGAQLFLPAMSTGEVGAAAGALTIATAAFFAAQGIVDGASLCLFRGERRWRGAAIVSAPRAKRTACSPS